MYGGQNQNLPIKLNMTGVMPIIFASSIVSSKSFCISLKKSAYTEYRKTYQQKFGIVNKNKDDKKLKKEFETWKKQAKEKINDMKKGKLTENEVYNWILNTK